MIHGCIQKDSSLEGVQRRSILSPTQSARVVAALRRRLHDLHKGIVTELAKEMGVGQPTLQRTLAGTHGASLTTAEALAHAMGVGVESILRSPRERAAELCREMRISEIAIRHVLAEPEEAEERAVLWYVDRMRAFAQLESGSIPVTQRRAG